MFFMMYPNGSNTTDAEESAFTIDRFVDNTAYHSFRSRMDTKVLEMHVLLRMQHTLC